MEKSVLLVASGYWEAGLMFSYQRAFEAFGFRVQQFDLDAHRRANIRGGRAIEPIVSRLMGYIDVPSITQKANRVLVTDATKMSPTIILVSLNELVRPATLVQLKVALPGTKIINIFPDTLFNLRDHTIAGLSLYDLFCTHTRAGIPYLEKLGCRAPAYVPLAADITQHKPFALDDADRREFGCDVVYVGNWRPEHEALFARLEGLDLAIWGSHTWGGAKNAWVRSRWRGRPLMTAKEYAKAHIAAKVCLNPIDPLNMPGHNQRVFELPACRVFSLVTRSEDTTSLFREGETIACFASPDELVEKARYYLAHANERERIAQAAYTHVVDGGHTYFDRVKSILDGLGLEATRLR